MIESNVISEKVKTLAAAMRDGRVLMMAYTNGAERIELHIAPDSFEDRLIAETVEKVHDRLDDDPMGPTEALCYRCGVEKLGRLMGGLCDPCAVKEATGG